MVNRNSKTAQEAKERDEFSCVKCGYSPSDKSSLHAHHITLISISEDDSIGNLATLCSECHRYAPDWDTLTKEKAYPRAFENCWSTCVSPAFDFALFGSQIQQADNELYVSAFQEGSLLNAGLPRLDPSNQWILLAAFADYKNFRSLLFFDWPDDFDTNGFEGLQSNIDYFSQL